MARTLGIVTLATMWLGCAGAPQGGADLRPVDNHVGPDGPSVAADASTVEVDAPSGPPPDACGTANDPSNCGQCGRDCHTLARVRPGAPVSCEAGRCVVPVGSCEIGFAHCSANPDEGCETRVDHRDACGGCGVRCEQNSLCIRRPTVVACEPCPADRPDRCEDRCVNLQSDPANCKTCGNECDIPNAEAICVNARCERASCKFGFGDCTSAPGCETDVLTHHTNCGMCGSSCTVLNGSRSCVEGACGAVTCSPGFGNCDLASPDCESPLNSHLNCGSCGHKCEGATPMCATVDGKLECTSGCMPPVPNRCGSVCVDIVSDKNHCGGCNKPCSFPNAPSTCTGSVRRMGKCFDGYADCNNDPRDGCEASLDSLISCGACGNSCLLGNTIAECVRRTCAPPRCLPGWGDCNKSNADCETPLATPQNCGACGRACGGTTPFCSDATGKAACVPGCPPTAPSRCASGCVDITSDPKNCGGCGISCEGKFAGAPAVCSGGRCRLEECMPGFVKEKGMCVKCRPRVAGVCGRDRDGIRCAISNGATAFGAATLWSRDFSDANGFATDPSYWATLAFPDVSGDGKADVCVRSVDGFYCGSSTGNAFEAAAPWEYGFSNWNGWNTRRPYWGTVQFPDLDADGKSDICGRGVIGVWCALSSRISFGIPTLWIEAFSDVHSWDVHPSYWATLQFPDVDGDDKADICGRGPDGVYCGISTGGRFNAPTQWDTTFTNAVWAGSPSHWSTIQFPDLNGDRKADLCGRSVDGLHCGLSSGTGFARPIRWADAFKGAAWQDRVDTYGTIQFADLNGDGKLDVCGRGPEGLICGLSTGTTLDPVTLWQPGFSDAAGWGTPAAANTIQFVDLDNDGDADVCGRSAMGIFCALSTRSGFTPLTRWSPAFSDADGWAAPESGATIAFPVLEAGNCNTYPPETRFPRHASKVAF